LILEICMWLPKGATTVGAEQNDVNQ